MAFEAQEKKALGVITSLYLVRMLGLFMVMPVLTIYGTQLPGATPFLLGLALGIYGLTQALFQIPFGWASDRFGRKPVLLFGFALFVLGSLVCAQSASVEALLIGRALQGAGAVSAVLLALLGDSVSEKNRTISMALIGVSIGVSFGISIVLGPVLAAKFNLDGLFLIAGLLGIGALLLTAVSIPRPRQTQKKSNTSIKSVISSPDLMRLNFSIFTLHFAQMALWVAVPGVLLTELGFNLDRHWMVYLIAVGGGFILMAPFMRFWDKRGQSGMSLVVGIFVILLSILSMSQTGEYHFFLLGLLFFFWGFNLLEATLPSLVTKIADPETKGTASGVYSTCQFLGVFLGGTCGGWIVAFKGVPTLFVVTAGLVVIWLLVMLVRPSASHVLLQLRPK